MSFRKWVLLSERCQSRSDNNILVINSFKLENIPHLKIHHGYCKAVICCQRTLSVSPPLDPNLYILLFLLQLKWRISLKAKGITSCLSIWVTEQTPGTTTLTASAFPLKYGLLCSLGNWFFLARLLLCLTCSSVFLHCPESTVICPP